jgi:hypothetical protein
VWRCYRRTLCHDGQNGPKIVTRFSTFKLHVSNIEAKLNKFALKAEVNFSVEYNIYASLHNVSSVGRLRINLLLCTDYFQVLRESFDFFIECLCILPLKFRP